MPVPDFLQLRVGPRRLTLKAVDALRETQNALAAIDRGRSDQAIAALERGTGKLEIVLARTPTLALAPVDTAVETRDVLGSVERVEAVREKARQALDRGRLQEARRLIGDLASETVISVSNLPLATCPTALKQAAVALHRGKPQEARVVLRTALSTIVVEGTLIPLPVARTEQAIAQAKGLAEKADRTAAENERLHASLAAARIELRFGQALGYVTEQDRKDLLAAVDEIERKTARQQHGTNLRNRIERHKFGGAHAARCSRAKLSKVARTAGDAFATSAATRRVKASPSAPGTRSAIAQSPNSRCATSRRDSTTSARWRWSAPMRAKARSTIAGSPSSAWRKRRPSLNSRPVMRSRVLLARDSARIDAVAICPTAVLI